MPAGSGVQHQPWLCAGRAAPRAARRWAGRSGQIARGRCAPDASLDRGLALGTCVIRGNCRAAGLDRGRGADPDRGAASRTNSDPRWHYRASPHMGWRSNALVVRDLPEDRIAAAGKAPTRPPGVPLCCQRRPMPGRWAYALYCMIHGRSRARAAGTGRGHPRGAVFSVRCFKQTGALMHRPPRPQQEMRPPAR